MPIAHGSTSARNLTIPERLSLRVRGGTIFALQRMDLKAILGNVDANSDILPHGRPPSWWRSSDHLSALRCPLGGAVHIIKSTLPYFREGFVKIRRALKWATPRGEIRGDPCDKLVFTPMWTKREGRHGRNRQNSPSDNINRTLTNITAFFTMLPHHAYRPLASSIRRE